MSRKQNKNSKETTVSVVSSGARQLGRYLSPRAIRRKEQRENNKNTEQ